MEGETQRVEENVKKRQKSCKDAPTTQFHQTTNCAVHKEHG